MFIKMMYSDIMNIGTLCTAGLSIKSLGLSKEKIPIFNDVMTNPSIIHHSISTDFLYYKKLNGPMEYLDKHIEDYIRNYNNDLDEIIHNEYGIRFLYQRKYSLEQLQDLLDLQVEIFKKKLSDNKPLLFIFTTEDTINNKKSMELQDTYYSDLIKLEKLLQEKYPQLPFKILAFHTNKYYNDTDHIRNINLIYPEEYIQDNASLSSSTELFYRQLITDKLMLFRKEGII